MRMRVVRAAIAAIRISGARADDRRQAVVLAQPEARVAERARSARARSSVSRIAASSLLPATRDRLVEHRERRSRRRSAVRMGRVDPRTVSGFSTGSMSRLTATASPSLRHSTHSSASVGAGVDLLVRHVRRHVDEVARAGLGGELELLAPAHARAALDDVDHAFERGRGGARRSSRRDGCAPCRPTASARRRARS